MPVDQKVVTQFLVNACPDHHVRSGDDHAVAKQIAGSILRHHPEIARDNICSAIVCGELGEVARLLSADPELARKPLPMRGSAEAQGSHFVMESAKSGEPYWQSLHYLCFTRLDHPVANDNAVAMARLLLDHGANPTAYFMAGDSQYTPLTGVVGAGEENREHHPRYLELARLLLERGADPYDVQVHYNLHFCQDAVDVLKLAYEFTVLRGQKADWDDPEWPKIGMGGYGSGARWHLGYAVEHNDLVLAEWMLSHGATPEPGPPPATMRHADRTLYDVARASGFDDFAELLVRHGAKRSTVPRDDETEFVAACLRNDRGAMEAALATQPALKGSARAMHALAELDRVDAMTTLLDLGVSPDVSNEHNQRALHTAAWSGSMRVARLLIDRGAEIDPVETEWGNTPMGCAIYSWNPAMADLIAPHSRHIWSLVFTSNVARVREVLASDPERAKATSEDGWTPLMWLGPDERAAVEIIKLFRVHGADAAAALGDGTTAEMLARKRWMLDAAAALSE